MRRGVRQLADRRPLNRGRMGARRIGGAAYEHTAKRGRRLAIQLVFSPACPIFSSPLREGPLLLWLAEASARIDDCGPGRILYCEPGVQLVRAATPILLPANIARLPWVLEDGIKRCREVWGMRQKQVLKDIRGRNAGGLPAVRAADPELQVLVPPTTITRRRSGKENPHGHLHCARKHHRSGNPKHQ